MLRGFYRSPELILSTRDQWLGETKGYGLKSAYEAQVVELRFVLGVSSAHKSSEGRDVAMFPAVSGRN